MPAFMFLPVNKPQLISLKTSTVQFFYNTLLYNTDLDITMYHDVLKK